MLLVVVWLATLPVVFSIDITGPQAVLHRQHHHRQHELSPLDEFGGDDELSELETELARVKRELAVVQQAKERLSSSDTTLPEGKAMEEWTRDEVVVFLEQLKRSEQLEFDVQAVACSGKAFAARSKEDMKDFAGGLVGIDLYNLKERARARGTREKNNKDDDDDDEEEEEENNSNNNINQNNLNKNINGDDGSDNDDRANQKRERNQQTHQGSGQQQQQQQAAPTEARNAGKAATSVADDPVRADKIMGQARAGDTGDTTALPEVEEDSDNDDHHHGKKQDPGVVVPDSLWDTPALLKDKTAIEDDQPRDQPEKRKEQEQEKRASSSADQNPSATAAQGGARQHGEEHDEEKPSPSTDLDLSQRPIDDNGRKHIMPVIESEGGARQEKHEEEKPPADLNQRSIVDSNGRKHILPVTEELEQRDDKIHLNTGEEEGETEKGSAQRVQVQEGEVEMGQKIHLNADEEKEKDSHAPRVQDDVQMAMAALNQMKENLRFTEEKPEYACLNPPFATEIISADSVLWGGSAGEVMVLVMEAELSSLCKEGQLKWVRMTSKPRDPDSTARRGRERTDFYEVEVISDKYATDADWNTDYLGSCGVAPRKLPSIGAPTVCPPGSSYPEQLHAKLKALFGTPNQLLTLEWPGRILSEETFKFDYVDAYSNFLKPYPIREAEFRLADDLFPLADITGGPSGQSLVTMYQFATNQLQESTSYPQEAYRVEKEKAREFLHREVDGMTVRERHDMYLAHYDNVTAYWKKVLSDLKNKARVSGTSMIGGNAQNNRDALAEEIVQTNDEAQQAMNQAYKSLVTDGYHHEVLSALSVLDVNSPGEMLQNARDALRNTGTSSLDGSEVIYPVSFQPAYWAEMLSTAFTSMDLLMDPAEALAQLQVAQDNRASVEDQLTTLTSTHAGNLDQLRRQKAEAEADDNNKFNALARRVGPDKANLLSLYCANQRCEGFKDNDFTGSDLPFKLSSGQEQGLKEIVVAATEARDRFLQAAGDLRNTENQIAMKVGNTFDSEVARLNAQVKELTKQIEEISSTYAAVVRQKGADGGKFDDNKDFFPSMPKPGPWARVILKNQRSSDTQASVSSEFHAESSDTQASVSSEFHAESHKRAKKCGFLCIFSSTTTETTTQDKQTSAFEALGLSSEFNIAFEAAKVTLDRGGWFKPEFLEHSDMFMKIGDKNISNGAPSELDWKNQEKMKYYKDGLLPSYPIAFVLARDITIKIVKSRRGSTLDFSSDKNFKSQAKSWAFGSENSKMGFSSNDQNSAIKVEKDALIIKISGAQIIMWLQNYISIDKSSTLVPRSGRAGYDVV
eukprot:g1419.t1